jgi:tetraacyldisaccharide 4'-kinase
LRYDVAGFRDLPDHHRYTGEDVARLTEWAEGLGVTAVVCTQKDMVKLRVDRLGSIPLWALAIELEITAGEADLVARLVPLAERARAVDYGASEKYW